MVTRKHNQELVLGLINSLTADEDLRQDLWVEYLSGEPLDTIHSKVLSLLITYHIQARSDIGLLLSQIDLPDNFVNFFSDIELHTMYLLFLGYNIGDISVALGKSRVAISDAITSLKNKKVWKKWRLNATSVIKRSLV